MFENAKKILRYYLPYVLIMGGLIAVAAITSSFTVGPQYKMYDQKWEKFDQQMYRYSIYDGWLVKYGSMGMTFVPDPAHQWKLDEENGR